MMYVDKKLKPELIRFKVFVYLDNSKCSNSVYHLIFALALEFESYGSPKFDKCKVCTALYVLHTF